jgi:hypothetical protein
MCPDVSVSGIKRKSATMWSANHFGAEHAHRFQHVISMFRKTTEPR